MQCFSSSLHTWFHFSLEELPIKMSLSGSAYQLPNWTTSDQLLKKTNFFQISCPIKKLKNLFSLNKANIPHRHRRTPKESSKTLPSRDPEALPKTVKKKETLRRFPWELTTVGWALATNKVQPTILFSHSRRPQSDSWAPACETTYHTNKKKIAAPWRKRVGNQWVSHNQIHKSLDLGEKGQHENYLSQLGTTKIQESWLQWEFSPFLSFYHFSQDPIHGLQSNWN